MREVLEALGEDFELWVRRVRRRMGPQLRSKVEPQDIVQEALARGAQVAAQDPGVLIQSPVAWFSTLLAHALNDAARSARRAKRASTTVRLEHAAGLPDLREAGAARGIDDGDAWTGILSGIEGLPEAERELARCVALHGLTVPAAARRLGLSRATAYRRLDHLVERLQASLTDGKESRRASGPVAHTLAPPETQAAGLESPS